MPHARDVGKGMDDTPDHIVFRCMKIKRIKDVEGRGRRSELGTMII